MFISFPHTFIFLLLAKFSFIQTKHHFKLCPVHDGFISCASKTVEMFHLLFQLKCSQPEIRTHEVGYLVTDQSAGSQPKVS